MLSLCLLLMAAGYLLPLAAGCCLLLLIVDRLYRRLRLEEAAALQLRGTLFASNGVMRRHT